MSDCCQNIDGKAPLLGGLCKEMEQRFHVKCEDMDMRAPFIDFKHYPPVRMVRPQNHLTTPDEVMIFALEKAKAEFISDYRSGKDVGKKGSFIAYLNDAKLLPPWIFKAPETMKEVKRILKAAPSNVTRLIDGLNKKVTYSGIIGWNSRTGDEVFRDRSASCIEYSFALFGISLLGGIDTSFAEQISVWPTGIFHIGLEMLFGEDDLFIDPGEGPKTGVEMTPFYELNAFAYYLSEQVLTGQRDIEWLKFAMQLVPNDFHIALSIWMWNKLNGHTEEARHWREEARKLNPSFKY